MLTCADCTTRYAQGLKRCPHCSSGSVCAKDAADASRVPVFATASCPECGWGPRRFRLNSPFPGVVDFPNLLCVSCGSQVQVPWPSMEESMPKITRHGGPSNAREMADSGADTSQPTPVSAPVPSSRVREADPSPSAVADASASGGSAPGLQTDAETGNVQDNEGIQSSVEPSSAGQETTPEPEPAPLSLADLRGMTLAELRAAAAERDVPTSGTKSALIDRLAPVNDGRDDGDFGDVP